MNKDYKSWFIKGAIAAAICVIALTIFLVIESFFFAREARELVRLKEDYANYVLAAKRMIADCKAGKEDEVSEATSSKKKKNITPDEEFVVVNRDFDYLRRSAVTYARRRHLAEAVDSLYGSMSWKAPEQQGLPKKRRKRMRRERQTHLVAVDNNLVAMRAEYHFILPLKPGTFRFTSRFGPRRRQNGSWGFHYGLDMAAPKGTPVKAVSHGVVVEARFARGFGNVVVISHSNKVKTRYAHLSKIDVRVGDAVEQGQRVGRVGNTGYTRGKNGVHLHFEVLVYGKQVNPAYFLG